MVLWLRDWLMKCWLNGNFLLGEYMTNLANKVILDFGGTGGIGKAVAVSFLEAGAIVVVVARNMEKIDNLKSDLNNPQNLVCIQADATKPSDVQNVFSRASEIGDVEGVFVGIGGWIQDDDNTSAEKLAKNEAELKPEHLSAPLYIAEEAKKAFEKKGGVYFHTSSHVVHKPEAILKGNKTYRRFKTQAEEELERFVSPKFRLVNLRPSIVRTPKNDTVLTKDGVDLRSKAVAPEDIANWCVENFNNPDIPRVMKFESSVVV